MSPHTCDWTLDLHVQCRLSILEARLVTASQMNLLIGRNGCGKSQLLAIIHSHFNSQNDQYLQDLGYRTYFSASRSKVAICGPTRIYHIGSSRIIAKDRDERKKGPYGFDELQDFSFTEQYGKFRKSLSRLAHDAVKYSRKASPEANEGIRQLKRQTLERIVSGFHLLFPGLSLDYHVDPSQRTVAVFAKRAGMPFVRPDDPRFGHSLTVPFATMSDGELNALYLLFQLFFHSLEAPTPLLFLIDEIENHLHPDLQLRVLELLQSALPPNAMLLATTHSPLVVSSVPTESRILMLHSSERPNRKHDNQLLFGRDADIARTLHDLYGASTATAGHYLLRDYQRMAAGEAVSYAEQCLREARAITQSVETDPQRVFLAGLIQGRIQKGIPVRVLDIGAGTGRLFQGLCKDFTGAAPFSVAIDAVEPRAEYRHLLQSVAAPADGLVTLGAVFGDIAELPESAQYDLVLLHNVVHELWAFELVRVLSRCQGLLSGGGALNVLEMAILPKGERKFFVFSESALQQLLATAGFSTRASGRRSHSGVPLYEITAERNGREAAAPATIIAATRAAVEATMAHTVESFERSLEEQTSPLHIAFFSLNLAYGHLLLRELAGVAGKGSGPEGAQPGVPADSLRSPLNANRWADKR